MKRRQIWDDRRLHGHYVRTDFQGMRIGDAAYPRSFYLPAGFGADEG